MTKVPPERVTEREAVNRVRALFERHGHVVQEIKEDFGEDLYLSFVEQGEKTGETVALQVKGRTSHRSGRSNNYRVRVGSHGRSWLRTNVPVACIVFDPETGRLHWANASEQLQHSGPDLASILVLRTSVLDDSIEFFVSEMRSYLSERGDIRQALGWLAGTRFDTTDFVAYTMNEYGEDLVFQQSRGESAGTLLHSDYGWKPVVVWPDLLEGKGRAALLGASTVKEYAALSGDPDLARFADELGDVELASFLDQIPTVGGELIVNQTELAWLRSCVEASEWWRSAPA